MPDHHQANTRVRSRGASLPVIVACLALGQLACVCGEGDPFGRDGVGGNGAGGAGRGGGGGITTTGGGGSASGGGGAATCDLVGGGGCECLSLATLGYPGRFKNGDIFGAWLDDKLQSGVVHLEGTVLTPDVLAAFQVLVVQDVRKSGSGLTGLGWGIGRDVTSEEVAALRSWVEQGGGLITLSGYYVSATELLNVNLLLEPSGLSYGSTPILSSPEGTGIPVRRWATHPVTVGVNQVRVDNGYPVQGGGVALAWEPSPGSSDVGRVATLGEGKVFAWGDEWISYADELTAAGSDTRRLWVNLLRWLTPANQCVVLAPP